MKSYKAVQVVYDGICIEIYKRKQKGEMFTVDQKQQALHD
jgi:hypothetical protein